VGKGGWSLRFARFRLLALHRPPATGHLCYLEHLDERFLPDDTATRLWAAELAPRFKIGDVVLLEGPLGAGKTTWVRGLLAGLGYLGPVRSPTFNLIQTFDTTPPVMHADLYRVASHEGIGIEDYLDAHLTLIEWPDRAAGLIDESECWRLTIDFADEGRRALLRPPQDRRRSVCTRAPDDPSGNGGRRVPGDP